MKRDMEMVRLILIEIAEGNFRPEEVNTREKAEKISYHLRIMKQAGLIDFVEIRTKTSGYFLYQEEPSITWEGNDYLVAISSETIWNRTKESIKSKGLEIGNVPFDVLKSYAVITGKSILGIE